MLELVLQPITRDERIEHLLCGQIDGCFSADPIAGNTKIAAVKMFRERLLRLHKDLDRLHREFGARVITHRREDSWLGDGTVQAAEDFEPLGERRHHSLVSPG